MSKRVLVTGGRDYSDWKRVNAELDLIAPELLIEGDASGADKLSMRWAFSRGIPCMAFPAQWDAFSKAAGPIRNGWMLKYGQPDLVLAFPGGRGTENMVKQAEAAGVEVRRVS